MFTKLVILLAAPAVLAAQQAPEPGFRPVSLAEAIRMAKENNYRIIQANNAVRTTSNTVRNMRAQLYPDLSLSAGQNKSAGERPGQNGQLVGYTSAWSYSTGLRSNITLYDGGRNFSEIKRTQADVASAETNVVSAQAQLEFDVKTQYNAVLAAAEQETANRAQLAYAQQNLAVAVARVNAGAATMADSLTAVVQVGNAEISILSAQQNMRTANLQLSRLVAAPWMVTANLSDTVDMARTPIDSASVMSLALESPLVRQLEAQRTANQAARRSAKASYLPTISAGFGFGGNGISNIYGLGVGPGNNPYAYNRSVSLSASYQVFNRFQRENQVENSQITLENTEAQLRDTRFGQQQTILVQLGVIRNTEAQMRVQQINVRASEEALRLIQARYQAGAATILEVLNAQSTLNAARNQLIQSRFAYRNARAQIEQVIGRSLP